jgi:hypothetical protein
MTEIPETDIPEAGGSNIETFDDVTPQETSSAPAAPSIAVGDTVKILDTFPAYRGEKGTVTRVRTDPAGGEFPVADVELLTVKQPGGEPVWFNNIPLSQIEKVEG